MEFRPLILIVIAVLIVLLGLFVWRAKGSDAPHQTNYRALFVIGISWIPIGLATENNAFSILGLIFMLSGWANRDKWDR